MIKWGVITNGVKKNYTGKYGAAIFNCSYWKSAWIFSIRLLYCLSFCCSSLEKWLSLVFLSQPSNGHYYLASFSFAQVCLWCTFSSAQPSISVNITPIWWAEHSWHFVAGPSIRSFLVHYKEPADLNQKPNQTKPYQIIPSVESHTKKPIKPKACDLNVTTAGNYPIYEVKRLVITARDAANSRLLLWLFCKFSSNLKQILRKLRQIAGERGAQWQEIGIRWGDSNPKLPSPQTAEEAEYCDQWDDKLKRSALT